MGNNYLENNYDINNVIAFIQQIKADIKNIDAFIRNYKREKNEFGTNVEAIVNQSISI